MMFRIVIPARPVEKAMKGGGRNGFKNSPWKAMRFFPPILLHFYITYRCNGRCSFCDIPSMDRLRGIPDAPLLPVKEILSQAKRLGVRFVDFTGGEPLLHDRLPEILEWAKGLGLRTSVTTNCLLYPERAQELRGLVDYLHFSLDGAGAEQHDSMRGTAVFHRVMESIDRARLLGERPDLLFTVTAENLPALASLCRISSQLGLMLLVNPVFSHLKKRTLPREQLAEIGRYAGRPFVYVNRALLRLHREGGNNTEKPRCRVLQATIVVSPDLRLLLPCFHFTQKCIPLDRPLQEIRLSQEFQAFFPLSGRAPFCRNCSLNCYFDPSFLYQMDVYFWESLHAKARYVFYKKAVWPVKNALGLFDQRPALSLFQSLAKKGE